MVMMLNLTVQSKLLKQFFENSTYCVLILLFCLDPIQSLPDPVYVPGLFNVVSSFFFFSLL